MKQTFSGAAANDPRIDVTLSESRARAERLELALRATNEGLFDTDLLTQEVYYSPRWKALLGYADNEIGTSIDEWRNRVHPEDFDQAWAAINAHLRGETPTCEFEHRLRHKDGTYHWYFERALATRDASGKAIRLTGSHSDVTDRKRAEAEVRRRDEILEAVRIASERFLRNMVSWDENVVETLGVLGTALDVSRGYIFENVLDESGVTRGTQRYEWVGPDAPSLLDYPNLYGFAFADLGWERWEALMLEGAPIVGRTRDFPPGEQEELKREGTLSLAVVPIFVERAWWGFIGFDDCLDERVWSPTEVDALKAAAGTLGAAIQRQQAEDRSVRLAEIVESTNDAIFGMLRNGTVTSWNAAAEALFGYTEAEMVGQRVHVLIKPARLERVRETLTALTNGELVAPLEAELVRKDGSLVWTSLTFSMLRDASGVVTGTSAIARDISARKRAETELVRRDAIMEAVRYAAERFLDSRTVWEDAIQSVLERLGRATRVSQVYVSRIQIDADGEVWSREIHHWAVPGDSIPPPRVESRGVPLRAMGLGQVVDQLIAGEAAFGHTRDFPSAASQEYALAQGVRSWAIVPIFVEGAWWGVMGLDEFKLERDFSAPERDSLKAAADTLGAAIGRQNAEERTRWLAAIVESSDDAIIGRTLDNTIVSWNDGAERLYGYTANEAIGQSIDILLPPGERVAMLDVFEAIRQGEHVSHHEGDRLHKDGTRRSVSISFSPVRNQAGEVIGSAAVSRDISRRLRAEAELRESQRSLSTLLSNLPGMAYRYRTASEWRMEFVSEGALELTGHGPHDLIDNPRLEYNDLVHPDDLAAALAAIREAVQRNEPFHVTYRIRTADGSEKWASEHGRPVHDETEAMVAIEGIVTDVTDRVLARQELERRVEERTRELATLLNVATGIASTLELRPLLGTILDQFGQVVEHVSAAIYLLDGETDRRLLDYRGPVSRQVSGSVRPLDEVVHSREVVKASRPVIIPDVRADNRLAASFRADVTHDLGAVPEYAVSWMGVPLIFREEVIGLLSVVSPEVDAYTERDAELALAFASHAAVAIVNARLYEQAQGTAALEERQRLARELHDSVSQALFGIGLGARTARTLIDDDPGKAAAPLDYVLSLAEAGLTEMRALIFELRPEALEQEGLVAALEKQAANLRARHGIMVEAELGDPGGASLAVEEAIYRIAQEAVNNTVKHARASTVWLRLVREPGRLVAEVADDGAGFDPDGSFTGHLGLRTMRERAERLGGTLELASAPGEGTRLRVEIPV